MQKVIEALQTVIVEVRKLADKPATVASSRFRVLADGWILDTATGKEWGPSSSKRMNWEEANKYAASKGGRLPTVKELISIVDYDRSQPAIDAGFFSDTKTDDWYWTGTEVAGYSSGAWSVDFGHGSVGNSVKGNDNYVRPVRASQCLII